MNASPECQWLIEQLQARDVKIDVRSPGECAAITIFDGFDDSGPNTTWQRVMWIRRWPDGSWYVDIMVGTHERLTADEALAQVATLLKMTDKDYRAEQERRLALLRCDNDNP